MWWPAGLVTGPGDRTVGLGGCAAEKSLACRGCACKSERVTEFFIAEIAPPEDALDEPSWAVQEFAAMDAEDSAETIGLPDFSATPAVVQASLGDQSNTARIHLLALLGATPDWRIGRRGLPLVSASASRAPEPLPVVGRGAADLPLRDNLNTAYSVDVVVRPGHRRRGIGSSLLRKLQELACAEGRATMVGNSWQGHETQIDADEAIEPSDGDIALDGRLPMHQLRLKHGYTLDQSERLSMCPLPVPDAPTPSPVGYEICVFPNGFPSSLYAELAQLMVGMSGDIPTGARPSETQVWDAERVAATFAQAAAAGMAEVAAAAKSKETGELVAYTDVSYTRDQSGMLSGAQRSLSGGAIRFDLERGRKRTHVGHQPYPRIPSGGHRWGVAQETRRRKIACLIRSRLQE